MISLEHISKRYGAALAVDDVSFTCPPGTVTGFLGPNGAGKSTTLRMLCGLTPATSGSGRVLGVRFRDLPNPGREVGVLLDASAQHPGRTARETLALAARVLGVPAARGEELLAFVGLDAKAAKRRVGAYSLGMRQRLGLALALLGGPQVLVLDEPVNGLDPQAIVWIRHLLRDFADRGGTVLLSSHLLREVETIADRVVVINRGRIVAERSVEELRASAALATRSVYVRAGDPARLAARLSGRGITVEHRPDGGLVVEAAMEAVGAAAAAEGVAVTELRPADGNGSDLESLFLSLTGSNSSTTDVNTDLEMAR